MSVTVRLYAGIRQLAGVSELAVEGDTIAAVRDAIKDACPVIADRLSFCRFALNDEFVGEDEAVPRDAAVDVIPPVSGG